MNPTRQLIWTSLLCCTLFAACTTTDRPSNNQISEHESTITTPASNQPVGAVDKKDAIEVKQTLQPQQPSVAKGERSKADGYPARERIMAKAQPMPASVMQLTRVGMPSEPLDRENYAHYDNNPLKLASESPVSTFSIDVDSGAYANVRRMLNEGRMPPQDAVRIEEMINYFSYDYQPPSSRKQPFRVTAEMAAAPWNSANRLLHIGIKGYEMDRSQLPASNLVFLVDVSGSMRSADKLGLLKSSLKMLTHQLSAKDRISLVVYAGASGVVLKPTAGNRHASIAAALDQLQAGGSTNGGAGIQLAYAMAEQAFIKGGINRIILATDGDFNVGTVNFEALTDLVEAKRKTGISLTTLGFGRGNYNDQLMEQLADKGNGNYAYIDTINEARKVLVDEIGSTLMTIAKDVKIQVEFNPAVVKEYRLIGYENRMLKREDFNNDKVDAGEIGAGHTVTALYEITLVDGKGLIDPLRYGKEKIVQSKSDEIAMLRLRYKQAEDQSSSDKSSLIEYPLHKKMIKTSLANTTDNFRFSAAVAAFGALLRGGQYAGDFGYDDLLKLAATARGNDANGYRGEFIQLVKTARTLDTHAINGHPKQNRPVHARDDGLIIE